MEKCKNCEEISNGSIIKVDKDNKCLFCGRKLGEQRTLKQNRSMHKLFKMLSDDLNSKGLDARTILKPSYSIWWTEEMIKRDLWCPLQKVMFGTEHTSELTTAQVSKVYQQLSQIIGEKFGVEIDFPSELETTKYYKSLEEI
jgi:hypothetical protein